MNAWIIEKPELQTVTQQILYLLLTALLWVFWIYLWLPLFSPWEQELGISHIIDNHMFTRHEYRLLLDLFMLCGIASLVVAFLLAYWAYHNYIPLEKNKRRMPEPITKVQIADHFNVDAYAIRDWHQATSLRVIHDEQGWVEKVDILDQKPAPAPAAGTLEKELDVYDYVDPRFDLKSKQDD
jgi:poly-beta-1,6-N-acetyl-D-glucosamine biosynthesis protein PgaD